MNIIYIINYEFILTTTLKRIYAYLNCLFSHFTNQFVTMESSYLKYVAINKSLISIKGTTKLSKL